MRFLGFFLVVGVVSVGCGDDTRFVNFDAGVRSDAAATDAFTSDAPVSSDAASLDGGSPDATAPDAPAPDVSTPGATSPGRNCNCDTECAGTATNPGLCVLGICMTRASADCSAAGSSVECPEHSRCWGLGETAFICWPDSDFFTCDGDTDSDGSCVPNDSNTCDSSCSEFCNSTAPCTADSCEAGSTCDVGSGVCVIDIGTPPPGPVPACSAGVGTVPDWRCASGCGDIVAFEPRTGPGYEDYPLNGETASNQYRSYIRRDVMMLIKYATAMVACQAGGWTRGNGGALGLGDMSEVDGAIPGTSIGSPGHPAGTHVDGHDMDIGYYQTGTPDNRLRPICESRSGGAEQYHCVGPPTLLDPWRTALFIGHLHINPNLRVIGVDGQVGVAVTSATTQLCSNDWLSTSACTDLKLAYEVTDMGRGWYLFHHHHLHVSVSGR